MNVLILKLGATGDVVRTTPLLRRLTGEISWLTTAKNAVMVRGIAPGLRCVTWEERDSLKDRQYDLVINLEDTIEVAEFLCGLRYQQLFGAYRDANGALSYTEDSRRWFDLSLISSFGKKEADRLKFVNRLSYQELIFESLGFRFSGETYLMPEASPTPLSGDIAIAPEAGPVWPMKNWAFYGELRRELEAREFVVTVLPVRTTLLEHLGDVQNHRCLVGGDSLPMHMALGTATRCVTLFTCTSPWEIYGYGLQTKIVSPLLGEFFYQRHFDPRATTAISLEEVLGAVLKEVRDPVAAI
jgi:heptosyltransferase-2